MNESMCAPQSTPPDMVSGVNTYQEDEISLLDLIVALLKYKKMIIWSVIVAGGAAVVISLLMTNIYRSEAIIAPQEAKAPSELASIPGFSALVGGMWGPGGDTDISKLEVVLTSHDLARRIVEKYNLLPILFKNDWDPVKKQWLTERPPTVQDAFKVLDEMLSVSINNKKNTISITFDHEDPRFAQQMVEAYLTELSEILCEVTVKESVEKQKFYNEQLDRTSDTLLRDKIYTLIATEIEKEIFARATKYYSFEVMDPPMVADWDKNIRPKRAVICILSVVGAFFLSICAAFLFNYFESLKETTDSRQLERLRLYLPGLGRRGKK